MRRVRFSTVRGSLAGLRMDGAEDRGTLLCVPGFTGSKEDFLHLLPVIAQFGWTAVAVDNLGQFESHDPPGPAAHGLGPWAQDVADVATELPGPVHLLGHSLGGLIAGRAARMFDWGSLVLLNSGSGPVDASLHPQLLALRSALGAVSLEEIWAVKSATDLANGWVPPSADVERFMHHRFVRNDPAALAEMARQLICGYEQDFTGVDLPILIAFGIDDHDAWPWHVQTDLARRWRLPLARIPDAAHSPAVEQPEATAALVAAHMAATGPKPDPCVRLPHRGYIPDMQIVTPLQPRSAAVPQARRTMTDHLWAWGLQDLADDAELVTSELVSNAIRHGGRDIEMRVTCLPTALRIAMYDNTTDAPELQVPGPDQLGGRGLTLVAAVADRWGYHLGDGGKEVWAELTLV